MIRKKKGERLDPVKELLGNAKYTEAALSFLRYTVMELYNADGLFFYFSLVS